MSGRHLAFDVGGANIKLATQDGYAASQPFALWKHPDLLAKQLVELIDASPPCDHIAATMTGELADCFASKAEGVHAIVDALRESARGRSLSIYLTDGTFVDWNAACELPELAAASNWHALATFAAMSTGVRDGVLVDIGSTTCDVIPMRDGEVAATGMTDTQRLLNSELVYVGIERTPVCSLTPTLPYRDRECPVARELFATTLDVHLLTGDIEERPNDLATADGRPATREFARSRLGRTVCADLLEFSDADALAMAEFLAFEVSEMIGDAIAKVAAAHRLGRNPQIILSGHGDFALLRVMDQSRIVLLSDCIGSDAARCAPAYAVACLADSRSSSL